MTAYPIIETLQHVIGRIGILGVASGKPSFWLPAQGSTQAVEVDAVWSLVYWITLFFFLLITFLLIGFTLRYRGRRGQPAQAAPSHNLPLEVTWTAVPILLTAVIFWQGFKGYMDLNTPPADALEVLVDAQQWKWSFTYPNGYVDENLHAPADRAVKLVMSSVDVIHGFYVPAFRIKRDVVPGRYNYAWFTATGPGEYDIFCTQYCGTNHSAMHAYVIVHPPGEFDTWLQNQAGALEKLPPAEAGEKIYRTRGCAGCHSVDGTTNVGPSFQGLFGTTVHLVDGSTALADENYIRECVLEPEKRRVAGFQPVMPNFSGRLKDKEITDVVEYFKTLAGGGKVAAKK